MKERTLRLLSRSFMRPAAGLRGRTTNQASRSTGLVRLSCNRLRR